MLLSIGLILCLAFCSVAFCKLALFLDSKEQENRFRLKLLRESYTQAKMEEEACSKESYQAKMGEEACSKES